MERVEARPGVAVLSIIGAGMSGTPGAAGKLFSSLGDVGVNVLEIAQGASELSISAAIDSAAKAGGNVLRYVAELDGAGVRVALREVPEAGPIGSLRGPDNIVVFRTARYADQPLVIRGPGAGADVTAAGLLGDVIKIARRGR